MVSISKSKEKYKQHKNGWLGARSAATGSSSLISLTAPSELLRCPRLTHRMSANALGLSLLLSSINPPIPGSVVRNREKSLPTDVKAPAAKRL